MTALECVHCRRRVDIQEGEAPPRRTCTGPAWARGEAVGARCLYAPIPATARAATGSHELTILDPGHQLVHAQCSCGWEIRWSYMELVAARLETRERVDAEIRRSHRHHREWVESVRRAERRMGPDFYG